MRSKRSLASAACELLIVLLVTAATFLWGVDTARAERGYAACGGEYLLLLIPLMYYIVKRIVMDWVADIREEVIRR